MNHELPDVQAGLEKTEKPGLSPCKAKSAIFSAGALDKTSSDWASVSAMAEMEKVIPWYRHSNTELLTGKCGPI